MSFWRDEVITFALDHETHLQIDEQRAWIVREPANPKPYYHLAQLYRVAFKQEEALGLLLHAVALDPEFGDAHNALAEIYIARSDDSAALRHAHLAESHGNGSAMALLRKYQHVNLESEEPGVDSAEDLSHP
jgi:tetratricopeptide (TPR) repeat protein